LGAGGFVDNLVPVTLGNIVGGGVFVALSYYVVYLRGKK
ncbi:MAG: formate transporter FocA, partial [Alphaproteobacteria bacterium]